MDHRPEPDRARARSRSLARRTLVMALLAIVVVGALSAWSWLGGKQRASGSTVPLNARSGVRYVGDAACVRCHEGIAKSYRQHPMGKSIVPIDEAPAEVRG